MVGLEEFYEKLDLFNIIPYLRDQFDGTIFSDICFCELLEDGAYSGLTKLEVAVMVANASKFDVDGDISPIEVACVYIEEILNIVVEYIFIDDECDTTGSNLSIGCWYAMLDEDELWKKTPTDLQKDLLLKGINFTREDWSVYG